MNILVAYLLLVSDGNEVNSFNMLRYLFNTNSNVSLRDFYLQGFPKLSMYTYILKELIKEELPEIHRKTVELGVQDALWLYKWLQSLFNSALPFSIVVRLWDCIFAYGIEFILNYSIAFVSYCKDKLLRSRDFCEFLDCFQIKPEDNIAILHLRELLITKAKSIRIDEEKLQKLRSNYEKYENDKKIHIIRDLTKSLGNSTTNTNAEYKNNDRGEILKFQGNMKYIAEENSQDEHSICFENDLDQIRFEWEIKGSRGCSKKCSKNNLEDLNYSERKSNYAQHNIEAVMKAEN